MLEEMIWKDIIDYGKKFNCFSMLMSFLILRAILLNKFSNDIRGIYRIS